METLQSQPTPYPDVKTSVGTYKNKANGAEVTLLGAIHLAHDPHYYPTLQQIMDDKSQGGAVVHYERVRKAAPQETQAVIDAGDAVKIMRRVRQIQSIIELPYMLLDGIEFVRQKEGIALRDHWENHDATVIDLASRFDSTGLFALSAISKLVKPLVKYSNPEARAAGALETLGNPNRTTGKTINNLLSRSFKSTVVDYRNDYALNAYDNLQAEQPGRDAVLFWGEGHKEGLRNGLERRGFIQIDEQSIIAIHGEAFVAQFKPADA